LVAALVVARTIRFDSVDFNASVGSLSN